MPLRRFCVQLPNDIRPALTRTGSIVVAGMLAACASGEGRAPQPVARLTAPADYSAAVDLEKDGLPAQAPPALDRRRLPDDPREPFSPNYGRAVPAASAAQPVSMPDTKDTGRDDYTWLQKTRRVSALAE